LTLHVEEITEIVAVCIDEDLNYHDSARCLMLSGYQDRGLGRVIYKDVKQTYEGDTERYLIKMKDFYEGPSFNYLALVHDNDSNDRTTGITHISNLRLYEVQPSCLKSATFDFTFSECTVANFISEVDKSMASIAECAADADPWEELLSLFGARSDAEVRRKINEICASAHVSQSVPYSQLMALEKEFLDEFWEGGTTWNYEIDAQNGPSLIDDAARINVVGDKYDGKIGISFPESHNFEGCKLRAAMCCYVAKRDPVQGQQAPADNSDACYMEFSNARQSSHVRDGYSVYDGIGNEGALNCHGFAWGNDAGFADAAFKGNTLFQVAMMHGLYTEGNVEELAGAPMCGCVEQMPVVTRANCTSTSATQSVHVKYNPVSKFVAEATIESVTHEDCGDLSTHYATLVAEGKASQREMEKLDKKIVGEGNCQAALEGFLGTKGFSFA
jgi:hypothetical protein